MYLNDVKQLLLLHLLPLISTDALEYDLHFFYKQAKSIQLMYGGSANHRRIVAEEMGL